MTACRFISAHSLTPFPSRYISQDEIARSVDAGTAARVQAVAQEFFHPDRLAITVLGPINGLKLKRADLGC